MPQQNPLFKRHLILDVGYNHTCISFCTIFALKFYTPFNSVILYKNKGVQEEVTSDILVLVTFSFMSIHPTSGLGKIFSSRSVTVKQTIKLVAKKEDFTVDFHYSVCSSHPPESCATNMGIPM